MANDKKKQDVKKLKVKGDPDLKGGAVGRGLPGACDIVAPVTKGLPGACDIVSPRGLPGACDIVKK